MEGEREGSEIRKEFKCMREKAPLSGERRREIKK